MSPSVPTLAKRSRAAAAGGRRGCGGSSSVSPGMVHMASLPTALHAASHDLAEALQPVSNSNFKTAVNSARSAPAAHQNATISSLVKTRSRACCVAGRCNADTRVLNLILRRSTSQLNSLLRVANITSALDLLGPSTTRCSRPGTPFSRTSSTIAVDVVAVDLGYRSVAPAVGEAWGISSSPSCFFRGPQPEKARPVLPPPSVAHGVLLDEVDRGLRERLRTACLRAPASPGAAWPPRPCRLRAGGAVRWQAAGPRPT